MNRTHQLRIPVRDLGCGDTGRMGLERVLLGLDGVLAAYVNPATEAAHLAVDPAHVDVDAVARAIAEGGYRPGRPVLDQQDRPPGRMRMPPRVERPVWHQEGDSEHA